MNFTCKTFSSVYCLWLLFQTVFCGIADAQTKPAESLFSSSRQRLTAAQWREDLQIAVDDFLERDRSFSAEARLIFRRFIGKLQKTAGAKNDEQIIVELAKAVALSGNAHTRLYILRNRSELRRYPIRVWWFDDGLYVVRASPEHAELLGAKIVKIGGRSVEKVRQAVDPLFAGNDSWHKYMSAYTMNSPDVLIGLGLIGEDGKAKIDFVNRFGKRGKVNLEPLALQKSNQPTESWWDLVPNRRRNDFFTNALGDEDLPLYLQNVERQYWSQFLPADDLFYLQFNRAGDAPEGESVAEFGERILAELQTAKISKLVVDLRFNTGGNLDIAKPLIKRLADFAVERKIKTYVITGRATFSAGLFHAMQLRQYANAVLVGEPSGDYLDFWAEGGNVTLPNSKLTLHYADRFHSYSGVERPKFKEYLFTASDLSVADSTLDIPVKTTARNYFAKRDPALEAIKRAR